MTIKKSKGFTIIELLVVVAIIAVLAAIVLVNVTGYINQGKNAAIKGNLATVLTNGAVFYDVPGNYTGFCASTGVLSPLAAANAASGATVAAGNVAICLAKTGANVDQSWCACSIMKVTAIETASSYFCVDSTGAKKTYVGQAANYCATACTAAAGACL